VIQLATLVCVWVYCKAFSSSGAAFGLSGAIGWLPLLLLHIAALSLGIGLWLSSLTAKYRDFTFVSSLILQIWMYATPVIYPLSQIPERWRWLAAINPMAMPVETIKYMFLGQGVVVPSYFALSIGITLVLLFSGVLVFNKIEKTFVDTV
jgi:lipopolysaccharide transport system permease protein